MNVQTTIEPDPHMALELALAKALPELEGAKKKSANPHFKSKYADLGSVIDAIRPIAEYGIWFRQVLHEGERGVTVETLYTGHGATISAGSLFMPADKANAQGFGSALTYARRYALQAAFGLPSEDDDGNAASEPRKPAQAEEAPPPEYLFPEGPAKNITALKGEVRSLWREIAGCGDDDTLGPLLELNKPLLRQVAALENPGHRRELWEGDGKDNPGLKGHILNTRAGFGPYAEPPHNNLMAG